MASEISAGRRMAVGFFAGISGGNVQETLDLMEERENKRQAGIKGKEFEQQAVQLRSGTALAFAQMHQEALEKRASGLPPSPEMLSNLAIIGATAIEEAQKLGSLQAKYINENMDNEYAVKAFTLIGSQQMQQTTQILQFVDTMGKLHDSQVAEEMQRKQLDIQGRVADANIIESKAGAYASNAQADRTVQATRFDAELHPAVLGEAEAQASKASTEAEVASETKGASVRQAEAQATNSELIALNNSDTLKKSRAEYQRMLEAAPAEDRAKRRAQLDSLADFVQESTNKGRSDAFIEEAVKDDLPPGVSISDLRTLWVGSMTDLQQSVGSAQSLVDQEKRAVQEGRGSEEDLKVLERNLYSVQTLHRRRLANMARYSESLLQPDSLKKVREDFQKVYSRMNPLYGVFSDSAEEQQRAEDMGGLPARVLEESVRGGGDQ